MNKRGFSMIGLLFAVVVVGVMVLIFLGDDFGMGTSLPERPDGEGRTSIGKVAARTKDEVCRSNLRQVNMAVQIEQNSGNTPSSFSDLPGIGPAMQKCPIGEEAYYFDAAAGKVTCPHPGHENF
ncbi:MAG: hypothetical protein H0W86_01880 [Armatimonadetes bacterium]|nr:hypothetical protein [Armatimonadota bacterium]